MAESDEGDQQSPDVFSLADKATKKSVDSWWGRLDSGRQAAWKTLLGSAAVAVLGVPIVSVLLDGGATPNAKNFAASAWLLVITLPIAAAAGTLYYALMSPPKVTSGVGLLSLCAVVALGGVLAMNGLIEAVGGSLADFYCYNDGTVHETACRAFNDQGLVTTPIGSPQQNARFLANVTVLLIDARGWVMVACGAIGGAAAGYLIRREADPATQ